MVSFHGHVTALEWAGLVPPLCLVWLVALVPQLRERMPDWFGWLLLVVTAGVVTGLVFLTGANTAGPLLVLSGERQLMGILWQWLQILGELAYGPLALMWGIAAIFVLPPLIICVLLFTFVPQTRVFWPGRKARPRR